MDQEPLRMKFFIDQENELFLDADSTMNDSVLHLCQVFGVERSNREGLSIKLASPEFDDLEDAEIWLRDQPFWKPRVSFYTMPLAEGKDLKRCKIKEMREIRDLLLEDEDPIGALQYAKTIIVNYEREANSDDYYICGRCCAFFEENEAAVQCYDRALSMTPKHLGVMIDKGVSLLNLDREKEALEIFRDVYQDVDLPALVWYRIGLHHLSKARMAQGINAFRLSVDLEPDLGKEEAFFPAENRPITIQELLAKNKELSEISPEEILRERIGS